MKKQKLVNKLPKPLKVTTIVITSFIAFIFLFNYLYAFPGLVVEYFHNLRLFDIGVYHIAIHGGGVLWCGFSE